MYFLSEEDPTQCCSQVFKQMNGFLKELFYIAYAVFMCALIVCTAIDLTNDNFPEQLFFSVCFQCISESNHTAYMFICFLIKTSLFLVFSMLALSFKSLQHCRGLEELFFYQILAFLSKDTNCWFAFILYTDQANMFNVLNNVLNKSLYLKNSH